VISTPADEIDAMTAKKCSVCDRELTEGKCVFIHHKNSCRVGNSKRNVPLRFPLARHGSGQRCRPLGNLIAPAVRHGVRAGKLALRWHHPLRIYLAASCAHFASELKNGCAGAGASTSPVRAALNVTMCP